MLRVAAALNQCYLFVSHHATWGRFTFKVCRATQSASLIQCESYFGITCANLNNRIVWNRMLSTTNCLLFTATTSLWLILHKSMIRLTRSANKIRNIMANARKRDKTAFYRRNGNSLRAFCVTTLYSIQLETLIYIFHINILTNINF